MQQPDNIGAYLREIGRYPLLKRHEELELAKRYVATRDPEVKQWLVNCNLRLVVSIAKRYIKRGEYYGVPFLDLIQEGSQGLVRAIEKYNPESGYKISTYAYWWIRQGVTRAIANSGTIRLPVHIGEKRNQLIKAIVALTQKLGRKPTNQELALELDWELTTVEEILKFSRKLDSLDRHVGEDKETTVGSFLSADTPDAIDDLAEQERREQLLKLIDNVLDDRSAHVVKMRFGFVTGKPMTLDECSEELGVTRQRVQQIHAKAMRRLKAQAKRWVKLGTLDDSGYGEPLPQPKPSPPKPPVVAAAPPQPNRRQPPLKVYKSGDADYPSIPNPSIPDRFRPRSLSSDYSNDTTEPEQEIDPMATNEVLSSLLSAINKAEEKAIQGKTYQLPNRYQLCLSAGISTGYFHQQTHASNAANRAYEAAEQRLEELQQSKSATVADLPEEPNPIVITLENRVKELQAALEDEREINQDLQRKLKEQGDRVARLQEQHPIDNNVLLKHLRQSAERELQAIACATQEIDQATRDREIAQRKLAEITLQIEQLQEKTVHTNGHLAGVN
ncbi:sigma-70 family RNA polymerase sigma factor [Pantanalinema sp. GBBB05]|uniref:sigma-70 family RNA polymerase sigma factor n=1 Tax=Pantanalinema sp. GBBB05 TaxID=2604139 RepID=UPI001D6D23AC|nr:sigma-70 family RNA polymerase sigma factor [Pantanalinema sp. GBBB05]